MGEDIQLPQPQPTSEIAPAPADALPAHSEPAPEAMASVPPPAEQQPDYNQLLTNVETATDAMILMAAVSALEKARQHDKAGVYSKGYEAAVRLGDRELALMYGNRVTAEISSRAASNMHEAVGGMNQSSSLMKVAADTIAASADLISRTSHRTTEY